MEEVSGDRRMSIPALIWLWDRELVRREQFNSIQLDWDFLFLTLVNNRGHKLMRQKQPAFAGCFLS